jgi:threonine-phosphate decarboxylase
VVALPEVDNRRIIHAFSICYDLPFDQLLAGNGTTQFIYALPKALGIKKALILAPTYSDYADSCRFHGVPWDFFLTTASKAFNPDLSELNRCIKDYDAVFLCNPNNPTGCLIPGHHLAELCSAHPSTRFIIDESYLPFAPKGQEHSLLQQTELPNLVVLHSLSKIFGIPGLRIGFIKAAAPVIKVLAPHLLPWSVNTLAQIAAIYLLTHPKQVEKFINTTRIYLASERTALIDRLQGCQDLRCFQSTTSFILLQLPARLKSHDLCRYLENQAMLIRNCENFIGLGHQYIRIALKSTRHNMMITQALTQWLDQQRLSDAKGA